MQWKNQGVGRNVALLPPLGSYKAPNGGDFLGGQDCSYAFCEERNVLKDMASTIDSIVPFHTVDEGVVKRVLQYGADLELVQTGARAYLHISRFSDDFTSPPLTDFVRVGDVLPVIVGRFDDKHNCWEVSHKSYQRFRKFETLGLVRGEKRVAEIQHATELRCTLKLPEALAYLSPPPHPWSRYRVLFESGRLAGGKSIEVVLGSWSSEFEGLVVHLPQACTDQLSSKVHYAEVILLRPHYIKKKHRLQNVMYAQLDDQHIARVDVSELRDLEGVFPIGSQVPIRLKEADHFTGLIDASMAWEHTQLSIRNVPLVGEVRACAVIWTSPYGAHCLLDNRVVGFMHKSSVIGSIPEQLDKYLHPGDIVEVKVLNELDISRGTYKVEFVRRIERFLEEQTEESALLDLAAIRRTGMTGGFARDSAFRWSVLDAYDHCCCVCGRRFAVRDTSAMEAAHVVPRGNRGGNLLQNALCLCPIHHWAFDKGLLAIDDDLSIRVAEIILGSGDEGRWLADLHGQAAHIVDDAPISRPALAWHRRNIFLDT